MNHEQIPERTVEQSERRLQLRDISQQTRESIEQLKTKTETVVEPVNLYLQSNTLSTIVSEFYDSDCRGGSYSSSTRDIHHLNQVTMLRVKPSPYGSQKFSITVNLRGLDDVTPSYHEVSIRPEAVQFYEDIAYIPERDRDTTERVQLALAGTCFGMVESDVLQDSWRDELYVRPTDPMMHPIIYTRHKKQIEPLRGPVKRIEHFRDKTGITQARVMPGRRSEFDSDDSVTTDWHPLDRYEFYTQPRRIEDQLYNAATRLFERDGSLEVANQIIESSENPLVYKLPLRMGYRPHGHPQPVPEFVLGRLDSASKDTIGELFTPEVRQIDTLYTPVLRCDGFCFSFLVCSTRPT